MASLIAEEKNYEDFDKLFALLKDPEIQSAASTVLSKMPTIAQAVSFIELASDLVGPILQDREFINHVMTNAKQTLKPINQESMGAALQLAGQLPLLVKLTSLLEVVGRDLIEPFANHPELVEEVRLKAAKDTSKISALGLLKLTKHPTIQQLLHLTTALLDVAAAEQNTTVQKHE